MVSNYNTRCKYSYTKLKNVVYLLSEAHAKNIHIDGDEAYIDGLTELPLRLNGFNIQLQEQSSLDERYKFQKTLTLSMHGYVNHSAFEGRYYAIVENEDGTRFMVNVDFPAKVTHTFNLSREINQTDFTFASLSNFPTLKLNADFEGVTPPCLGFNVAGIDKLQLLEVEKTKLDTIAKVVMSTESFKDIEFLRKSCTYQEVYDGEKVTDTITFNIPFDDYKSDWQYHLLEFMQNKYAAIITPKGNDNKYYVGFNFGLEPQYSIQTASQNGTSDIITITLSEISIHGSTAANDWTDEHVTQTRWRYIKNVGDLVCWECVGLGQAMYLVQQEVDSFGFPTGNYKVLQGYESQFSSLNIVGTFTEEQLFQNNECNQQGNCVLTTDIPLTINFNAATCYTYNLSGTCDWSVTNVPSGITVSPLSGVANSAYTLTVCNTITPTSNEVTKYFNIVCGDNTRRTNVVIKSPVSCVRPLTRDVNCLEQTVTFAFEGTCTPIISGVTLGLTYSIQNNIITVNVPKSIRETARQYFLTVTNCNCSSEPITLTINQDKCYYQWLVDGDNFLCASGNSYHIERRYTGATADNINKPTDQTRRGSLISSGDSRCEQIKWEFLGHYICEDGNKFELIEALKYDGSQWVTTGEVDLGDMVEENSSFCESEQIGWQLTDKIICLGF